MERHHHCKYRHSYQSPRRHRPCAYNARIRCSRLSFPSQPQKAPPLPRSSLSATAPSFNILFPHLLSTKLGAVPKAKRILRSQLALTRLLPTVSLTLADVVCTVQHKRTGMRRRMACGASSTMVERARGWMLSSCSSGWPYNCCHCH
jgi:hypothetical protein